MGAIAHTGTNNGACPGIEGIQAIEWEIGRGMIGRMEVYKKRKNRGSDSQREAVTQREYHPVTTSICHESTSRPSIIAPLSHNSNFDSTLSAHFPYFLGRLCGMCRR